MESGLLSEVNHRQQRMTQLKTWVFASANDADKLLAPLFTRFTVIHLKPYTKEEFVEIAVNVLNSGRTQREKDRLAEAITDDVIKIFNIDKKDIIIVFQEEPHGNWYAEGIRL
jgi:4-oxalocrotonate tautomerase